MSNDVIYDETRIVRNKVESRYNVMNQWHWRLMRSPMAHNEDAEDEEVM